MLLRAALLTTFVLAAALPLAAGPHTLRPCEHGLAHAARLHTEDPCGQGGQTQQNLPPIQILVPVPEPLGDIVNGRGPDQHTRELEQFAVYAAIGNRDGMEILSGQLRKFGITRDELQEVVDRSKLHSGLPPRQDRTDTEFEQASKLSQ